MANVKWDAYQSNAKPTQVTAVFLQCSDNLKFPPGNLSGSMKLVVTNDEIRSQPGFATINIESPFSTLKASVLYVRVRTQSQNGRVGGKFLSTLDAHKFFLSHFYFLLSFAVAFFFKNGRFPLKSGRPLATAWKPAT